MMKDNDIYLRRRLLQGATNGDLSWIEEALQGDMSVDVGNITKKTALHSAALNNQTAAMKLLLEAGAEINVVEQGQFTPLHYAVCNGKLNDVKMLLAAGADLTMKTQWNDTPVSIARDKSYPKLAIYLQSILDDPTKRPTPEEAGLDMNKRIAALEALGKPLGKFTEQERRRQAQRDTREAQRQAALRGEGI